MQKLRENASTEAIKLAAELHAARLQSHPATESLAPPVEGLLTKMVDADAEHHKRQLARMILTGKLNYADSVLDDLIMDASRQILTLTGGDREDTRYRAAFTKAPSEGVEDVASTTQDAFVSNVAKALRSPALSSLVALADPIEAAQAEVERLRAERDAAYIAEANAFSTLQLARVHLVDHINANLPHLMILFPKKKRQVNSFFA